MEPIIHSNNNFNVEGFDFFENMSDEIVLLVLSYLNKTDVSNCSALNKRFNIITQDKSLPLNKFYYYSPKEIKTIKRNLSRSDFIQRSLPWENGLLSFHVKNGMLARGTYYKKLEVIDMGNGNDSSDSVN